MDRKRRENAIGKFRAEGCVVAGTLFCDSTGGGQDNGCGKHIGDGQRNFEGEFIKTCSDYVRL